MKILATIDFSTTSENILRTTKTYAKKMDAEVFLMHAEPSQTDFEQEESDTKPESMRLKKDAQALERAGVKVTPVFLQGPVCETIIAKAIELEADLIITGSHGHGRGGLQVADRTHQRMYSAQIKYAGADRPCLIIRPVCRRTFCETSSVRTACVTGIK